MNRISSKLTMFLPNPCFVLALVVVSSFGNFPSVSALEYFMHGGYISTTNVEDTAERDGIQGTFEGVLEFNQPDICPNLVKAKEFFDGVLPDQSPPFLKDIPTYTGTQSRIFNIFSSFYGINDITNNYARRWAKAALSGGKFFGNEFGNWGTMTDDYNDCSGQYESAIKGTAYLSGLLEVNQYMEQASALIRNSDCVLPFESSCQGAVNAWNKAAAFFVGSLEGAVGVPGAFGKMLYSLGDRRCHNFRKCGVNADSDARIISKTNIVSIALFQKGERLVFAGDVEGLQKTIKEINAQILITFIQGSLRYGYRLGDFQETPGAKTRSSKGEELGAGATFAACAAPQLWAISKRAGRFVSKQYKIGPEGPASRSVFDFVGVRNAFECNYKKLGISCDEIGALWDSTSATVPKSRQCTDLKECKKRKKGSIPSRMDCIPYTDKKKNEEDFYP
mmetsp:Transcript_23777/g.27546  ORF Transcript_23777/g.27546 Transcript_23777/m.27546 type:complete len:449 (+) Transcript_23777:277-1623(+)